ncbi:hypothetical protein [Qipengyuania sp.]|uniref:hypothetical protein n=1 Tax=Qipengyuania sp. TaxID=2004515 RepID=UPI003736652E
MTNSPDTPLSGEARLRQKRRRFIGWVAAMGAGFAILGFATGYSQAAAEGGRLPGWIIIPLIAAAVIGLVLFSASYFRRIDEVDLQDNLWSSLIGLYYYLAAFPAWHLLHMAGYVAEPSHWVLWGSTALVATAAYVARKLGLR